MLRWIRVWLGAALFGACLAVASPAHAWLNTSVQADNVLIELSRDGSAVVSHEILMRVRGERFKEFVITGVDSDAVPSGDATIVRAKSGREAGIPIPLVASGDSEGMRLAVTYEKGLSSGAYLVRFSYKTQLQARDRISRSGDWAVVTWTGPQFGDGLDLLQTTFVVPHAERAPRLLGASETDPSAIVAREEGVFLSEVHRGADLDRLTLSRPHAAKSERVTWQAEVDASLFSGLVSTVPTALPEQVEAAPIASSAPPADAPWRRWALTGLMALLIPVLGFLKHWGAGTAFVVPLGVLRRLRWALSALALATSLFLALELGATTWAGVLLSVSMLLSLQKPTTTAAAPRGPGRWQDVDFEALEFALAPSLGRAAWLDAGSWKGLCLFVLACLGFMVTGLRLLGASPYHSAMTLVYSATLVPLFFTLGSLNAKGMVEQQRDFLRRLAFGLRKWRAVGLAQRGRFALGAAAPDELRLGIVLADARSGLVGIDIGVGFASASLRRLALPVVIVRVRDGSAAHRALPRDAEWSRGRDPEERVVLLRPPLPLLSACIETVREVCHVLRDKPRRRAAVGTAAGTRAASGSRASASVDAGAPQVLATPAADKSRAPAVKPRRAFAAPKPGTASA